MEASILTELRNNEISSKEAYKNYIRIKIRNKCKFLAEHILLSLK